MNLGNTIEEIFNMHPAKGENYLTLRSFRVLVYGEKMDYRYVLMLYRKRNEIMSETILVKEKNSNFRLSKKKVR